MKRWLVFLFWFVVAPEGSVAMPAELPEAAPEYLPRITVRLYNNAGLPPEVLLPATEIAGKILREAGVQVVWWNCAGATSMVRCENSVFAADYRAFLLPKGAESKIRLSSSALGFVLDDPRRGVGRTAWVLCARIQELAEQKQFPQVRLLGYVLAHELGHLLLGSADHPPNGLMRGLWQDKDLQLAAQGALLFT